MSSDQAQPDDRVVSDRIDLTCPICDEQSSHDRATVDGFIWHCDRCGEAIHSFHHGQWFISEHFLRRAGAAVMGMTVEQAQSFDPDEADELIHRRVPSIRKLGEAMNEIMAETSRRPLSDN